jgi:hypothetical protein
MADSAGLMPALPQEPEPAKGPAEAGPLALTGSLVPKDLS